MLRKLWGCVLALCIIISPVVESNEIGNSCNVLGTVKIANKNYGQGWHWIWDAQVNGISVSRMVNVAESPSGYQQKEEHNLFKTNFSNKLDLSLSASATEHEDIPDYGWNGSNEQIQCFESVAQKIVFGLSVYVVEQGSTSVSADKYACRYFGFEFIVTPNNMPVELSSIDSNTMAGNFGSIFRSKPIPDKRCT